MRNRSINLANLYFSSAVDSPRPPSETATDPQPQPPSSHIIFVLYHNRRPSSLPCLVLQDAAPRMGLSPRGSRLNPTSSPSSGTRRQYRRRFLLLLVVVIIVVVDRQRQPQPSLGEGGDACTSPCDVEDRGQDGGKIRFSRCVWLVSLENIV